MISSSHISVYVYAAGRDGEELVGLERTWALCCLAKGLPTQEWEFRATEYVRMPWMDDSKPRLVTITSPDQVEWEEEFAR